MLFITINRLTPYFAFVLAMIVWGGLPAMIKMTLSGISISLFITIRFVCSSLFLSPLLFSVVKKAKNLPVKYWLSFIITISIMFYSQTWVIQQVPAIMYIVVFSATPVLMALYFRYQMQTPAFLGLFIVIFALTAFIYEDNDTGVWSMLPMLAMLISMASWIAYTVVIKQFHAVFNDLEITAITCFSAAIVSLLVSIVTADLRMLSHLSITLILNAAIIGLILPLAFLGYSYALRKKPIMSIFGQYLEPIAGIIIATILIGGTISVKQMVSFLFVLLGISLLSSYSNQSDAYKT